MSYIHAVDIKVGNLTFNGYFFSWRKLRLLCAGCNEVSFELVARTASYSRRLSGNQCIAAVFVVGITDRWQLFFVTGSYKWGIIFIVLYFLLTYVAVGKAPPQRGETVEPVWVTIMLLGPLVPCPLVVSTPSSSLSCLCVEPSICPLLTLLTTLSKDLCRSIVVVVVEIKTDTLIAGVVNRSGILCGSTPGVKTGGSVTLNRISPAVGLQAIRIPDPSGEA